MRKSFRFTSLSRGILVAALFFSGGALFGLSTNDLAPDNIPAADSSVAPAPPVAPAAPVAPRADARPPHGSSERPELVAVIAILGAFTLVGIGAYFRFRRSQMLHETIRLMVEKGTAIPPELLAIADQPKSAARPRSDLRRALICAAVGIGLLSFPERSAKSIGWIFICVAVAYIVNWRIEKKTSNKNSNVQP